MRVAHVVRQYLPSVGGMEEVVRNLVAYQTKASEYEPSVITLNRVFRDPINVLPEQDLLEDIPVQRLAYTGSERYPFCPQVLRAVASFDLVHVHGVDFFFDYLASTRLLHRKPLIASTHGGFFHTQFAQTLKKVFFHTVTRTSCLGYQRVIATSNNDGDIFSKVTNAPRLLTIENGVDIEKFCNTSSQELKPSIIYFGRWSVNKGLLEALQVFAELCRQQVDVPWEFAIAGREYDLTAQDLRNAASELGVAQRIHIYVSPSNAQINEILAGASYFLCLSKHEGFGIAPVEAMSAGLLPLLSHIPPFEQLVRNTGVGLILPPGPAANLASLIAAKHTQSNGNRSTLHDTERARAISASQSFSWDKVGALYSEQYAQVLHRGSK